THRGGRATFKELLADTIVSSQVGQARTRLMTAARQFEKQLASFLRHPELVEIVDLARLDQLLQDAQAGIVGSEQLIRQILERHSRVQHQKRKGAWIEWDDPYLTLIPGFGDGSSEPWAHDGTYLHPFRVTNVYSFLADLGRIEKVEVPDAE